VEEREFGERDVADRRKGGERTSEQRVRDR